jgi:hypothetical protein
MNEVSSNLNFTEGQLETLLTNTSSFIFADINNTDINSNDSSFNASHITVLQVIYSNRAEQVISCLLASVLGIFSIFGQGAIIITIFKNDRLHDPHFFIIVGVCLADLISTLFALPSVLFQFIAGYSPQLYGQIGRASCRERV